jgi:hypothetical protein
MHCISIFQNHLSRGKHILSVHQPHMLWLSVWSKRLANLPWCSKASDRNKNLLPLYSSDTILNLPKPTNPTTSLTWPTLSQNCIVPGEAQLTALMKTLPTLLNLYICLVIRNGWTGELIQLTPGQGPSKEVHPTAHYHIWSWKAGAEHLYLTLFIIPKYQIMFVKPDE